MPLPLLLLKLYWAVKILKFPFVAIADTLREYRRRRTLRHAKQGQRRHGFFDGPLAALRDRHFWVKAFTNSAEVVVHVASVFAWLRNTALRLTRPAFLVWHPHHSSERRLYARVMDSPWPEIRRQTGVWLADAFRLWTVQRERMSTRRWGRKAAWREVLFDGGFIAVRLGRTAKRGCETTFRRPRSDRALIITHSPNGLAKASVVRDGIGVEREWAIE